MPRLNDLTNRRFGRLVVISRAENIRRRAAWHCQCDCGKKVVVSSAHLVTGNTKSCGCSKKEINITHGLSYTRTYRIWKNMKTRCYNPKSSSFKYYGERGIRICERWRENFTAFLEDMGPCPSEEHSIDRVDSARNYEPTNCRWSTHSEQANNRNDWNFNITFQGETKTLAQWSEILNFDYEKVRTRLRYYGWSVERAFSEP